MAGINTPHRGAQEYELLKAEADKRGIDVIECRRQLKREASTRWWNKVCDDLWEGVDF